MEDELFTQTTGSYLLLGRAVEGSYLGRDSLIVPARYENAQLRTSVLMDELIGDGNRAIKALRRLWAVGMQDYKVAHRIHGNGALDGATWRSWCKECEVNPIIDRQCTISKVGQEAPCGMQADLTCMFGNRNQPIGGKEKTPQDGLGVDAIA